MRFKNKTVIITGAATGIGKSTAIRLGYEGANVIIIDIKEDLANAVAEEISKQGGTALAFQSDVRDSAKIYHIVDETVNRYGGVDILINNAGGPAGWYYKEKHRRFIDTTEETWRMIVDINLIGTMIVTRAVLDYMIEKRKGKIINVGSVAGVTGLKNMVDYSAAKGGVIAMTRALAIELGEYNINVNCVSPGSIDTHNGGPATYLKRLGKPDEVANLILFLASDESDFITGQNYIIDGGRVLSTKCE